MTKHNKYYWDLDRNKPYKDYLGSSDKINSGSEFKSTYIGDKNNEELNNQIEMNNNKQSSVEFLQECLSIHLNHKQQMQFEGLFQQAKAMEKEQMIEYAYEINRQMTYKEIEADYNAKFKTKER